MELKPGTVFWMFIWCIFMGITVGAIGIGAVFPSANLIAGPFVCPTGSMQHESQLYTVSPVETVTTLTWYCVDAKTGTQAELGIFPMTLYSGAIYGLLFFLVVFIGMELRSRWRQMQTERRQGAGSEASARFREARSPVDEDAAALTADERIDELSKKVQELQAELEKQKKGRQRAG